jgi:probable phosphoglycerate mutase
MTDNPSVTTIYLLRHGAYENPLNIFHGRLPGFPLSGKGKQQAEALGQSLAHEPIAAVYASPLTRTYQTAQEIAKPHGLAVIHDERLMDVRTPLAGRPLSYMESINYNFYRPTFIRQGGETLRQIFTRIDACLRDVVAKHRGGHIAVVSHGDPIMSVKTKYLGLPLRSRKLFYPYIPVASGYVIRVAQNHTIVSIADYPAPAK